MTHTLASHSERNAPHYHCYKGKLYGDQAYFPDGRPMLNPHPTLNSYGSLYQVGVTLNTTGEVGHGLAELFAISIEDGLFREADGSITNRGAVLIYYGGQAFFKKGDGGHCWKMKEQLVWSKGVRVPQEFGEQFFSGKEEVKVKETTEAATETEAATPTPTPMPPSTPPPSTAGAMISQVRGLPPALGYASDWFLETGGETRLQGMKLALVDGIYRVMVV